MYGHLITKLQWLVLLCLPACGFHWVTGEGRIGEVHICDHHNCDTEILSPLDPIILRIAVDDAPYGTRVASVWYYIEPPLKRILLRERISDVDHPQWVLHRLEPPRPGYWKEGLYLVEVTLHGKITTRISFRMPPRAQDTEASPSVTVPSSSPHTPRKKDILDEEF